MNTNSLLNFAHLCDTAFLSQSGKLNIIGIFQKINTPLIPFHHPRITCALNISITERSLLKIQIVNKRTKELLTKLEGQVRPPNKGTQTVDVGFIGNFQNIHFEKEGVYECEIWIQNKLQKSLPFSVEYTPIKNHK